MTKLWLALTLILAAPAHAAYSEDCDRALTQLLTSIDPQVSDSVLIASVSSAENLTRRIEAMVVEFAQDPKLMALTSDVAWAGARPSALVLRSTLAEGISRHALSPAEAQAKIDGGVDLGMKILNLETIYSQLERAIAARTGIGASLRGLFSRDTRDSAEAVRPLKARMIELRRRVKVMLNLLAMPTQLNTALSGHSHRTDDDVFWAYYFYYVYLPSLNDGPINHEQSYIDQIEALPAAHEHGDIWSNADAHEHGPDDGDDSDSDSDSGSDGDSGGGD